MFLRFKNSEDGRQKTEDGIQNTEFRIQNSEYRIQNIESNCNTFRGHSLKAFFYHRDTETQREAQRVGNRTIF